MPGPIRFLVLLAAVSAVAACGDLGTDFEYGSVTVETLRRSGEPAVGVEVALYRGSGVQEYATTGANGTYTFEFVPFGSFGVVRLGTNGFRGPGMEPTSNVDGIEVDGDDHRVEFVVLKVGPGTVRVSVRESEGEGISGVPVTLYDANHVFADGATDASGVAVFDSVPFGNYGVLITTPGGGLEHVDGLIVEDGVVEEVEFVIEPCEGTLRAFVRDAAGEPVPGVRVVLYNSREVLEAANTDAAGLARFVAPCGSLGVLVEPEPPFTVAEGRGSSFFDGIEMGDGDVAEVTFTLQGS